MNVEIEDSVITSGLPRAIEFIQESRTTGIREGFVSSNVTSTGVSPLHLEPVNFYEQALFKTIRDQANKRSRSDTNNHSGIHHSGIQYNIDRVDPPACTSQLSEEDKSEDDMLMIVNTLKSSEANLSVIEADDKGKVTPPELYQTVDVSVEESNMDPAAAAESVEVKLLSANLKKLEAVQIMMEIAKLEAEAKAKAAEVAILKAKLALKDANEGASNTQQGAGNGNKDVDITDSIERIIANAESQIILENSIVDSDSDSSPAPSLDDSEFNILPSPPSLVYESNDTSEAMPIIINLVDPPFIIRQSSVPSPSPEKSALEYTNLELEPEQRDENNITSKNNDGIDLTLELLYTKIEECRTKLMDPNSSMDDQTDAAQLMTQYAKSAQALKRAFRAD